MTAADLSVMLVWGAMTAYTIAFLAFTYALSRQVDVHRPEQSPRALGIARSTAGAGLLLHVGAIVTRGIAAGRTPWANMYEFTVVGTFVAVLVLVLVLRKRPILFLGTAVTGLVVLFLIAAQVLFFIKADGVQPALQSYWLVIHVGVAITAAGVFTVAFVSAALQILRSSRSEGRSRIAGTTWTRFDGVRVRLEPFAVTGERWQWLETTPEPRQLEGLSFRLNAIGFVLWTFTLIAGAIWAEHAWGRFWGWDPKEVWTFVIWVVYAAYLHARTTRGWAGRRAAWFVVVGYACVIANFTIVNMFFSGLHTYSQLKPTQ